MRSPRLRSNKCPQQDIRGIVDERSEAKGWWSTQASMNHLHLLNGTDGFILLVMVGKAI